MRIAVCFKALPDPDRIIESDWENFSPYGDLLYAGSEINCFDRSALEIGLRLREDAAAQGISVLCTAVSVAPRLSKSVSSALLAAGFDEVEHIYFEEREFVPEETARRLAFYVRERGCDIILTGRESGMAESGRVPLMLAQQLSFPVLSGVRAAALRDGLLCLSYEKPEGLFEGKADPPLVLCVGNSPIVLREASLRKRLEFSKVESKEFIFPKDEESSAQKPPPRLYAVNTKRSCKFLSAEGSEYESSLVRVLELMKEGARAGRNSGTEFGEGAGRNSETEEAGVGKKSETDFVEAAAAGEKSSTNAGGNSGENPASLYIFPDNDGGRLLAADLAGRKKLPLFFGAEISDFSELNGLSSLKRLKVKKRVYSGHLEWEKELSLPAVLTMRDSLIAKLPKACGLNFPSLTKEALSDTAPVIRNEKLLEPASESSALSKGLLIICGAGMGSKAACDKARALAAALGGGIGLTREAALNSFGSLSELIGQSGIRSEASCVLCLGTAGAGAFAVGIEDAETVISVNTDGSALIFGNSDIGLITDAEAFVDGLLRLCLKNGGREKSLSEK